MGGGDPRGKIDRMAQEQIDRQRAYGRDVQNEAQNYRAMGQSRRESLMPQIERGWQNYQNSSALSDTFGKESEYGKRSYQSPDYQRSGLADEAAAAYRKMGTGGIDESGFKGARDTYADFMSAGGGVDPAVRARLESLAGDYTRFGQGGGNISDADKARMRGGGVYDEFSKTGGLSEGDRANIRSRATSIIPSNFARANAEADRSASVQGGYGPGASIMKNQLRRQATQDSASAARDAELGIMDQVNQGREWGATGMERSEGNLQSLISQNTLAGLGGAAGINSDLAKMIQSGREFGATGSSGLEMGIAGLRQRGQETGAAGLAGLSGDEQNYLNRSAEGRARTGEMNVNRLDDRDRYMYERQNERDLTGQAGLQSMYGMGPSGFEQYGDQYQAQGMRDENASMLPYMNFRKSMNPSFMEKYGGLFQSLIGGGAGVAGAYAR
jgi:hypothetical protein